MLLRELVLILLLLLPVAAVVFTFWRERKQRAAISLMPFDELRRRPAGESVRLKWEEARERINDWLLFLVITPFVFAVALTFQSRVAYFDIAFAFLCTAVMAAFIQGSFGPC